MYNIATEQIIRDHILWQKNRASVACCMLNLPVSIWSTTERLTERMCLANEQKQTETREKWRGKKNELKRNIQLTTQTNSGDKLFHFDFGVYWIVSLYGQFVSFCGQHERDMTKMEETTESKLLHQCKNQPREMCDLPFCCANNLFFFFFLLRSVDVRAHHEQHKTPTAPSWHSSHSANTEAKKITADINVIKIRTQEKRLHLNKLPFH